jgi:hypothetical protein
VLVSVTVVAAVAAATVVESRNPTRPRPEGTYLALGDSIAFGFRVPAAVDPPDYADPASLVGYPELVGRRLHLSVVNTSCPGETVQSMIRTSAPSNGCENTDGKGGGYRTSYPLHVSYRGAQLAFAVSYLRSHHDVRLVSLGIGLNDTTVCRDTTVHHCRTTAERRALMAQIDRGLATIYHAIRVTAGYHGRIVAVTYYWSRYPAPSLVTMLDRTIVARARREGAGIAAAYSAFAQAAVADHGDVCATGLITHLRTGGCDKHPSAKGAALLATTVVAAVTPRRAASG